MKRTVERELYEMMVENTGSHMLDSGGAYGRNWERNKGKSLRDFKTEPDVTFKLPKVEEGETVESTDISYTISTFHYLNQQLNLDDICKRFNRLNRNASEWDSDIYGVSRKAFEYLESIGAKVKYSENSYNGESNLSQVIQYTVLEIDGDYYIALQIHGGCDVRGGYTNARLFVLGEEYLEPESVYGTVYDPAKEEPEEQVLMPGIKRNSGRIEIDNRYNGYSLTDEDGKPVPVSADCQVSLYLCIG